jgi:hypothetical protein
MIGVGRACYRATRSQTLISVLCRDDGTVKVGIGTSKTAGTSLWVQNLDLVSRAQTIERRPMVGRFA